MDNILIVFLGLLAGSLSGLLGIGGGVIIIPALIYFFGFSQHSAQGTTLAIMIPPIGLLAAWRYYVNGHVNIPVAILVAIGFFIGGLLGAHYAEKIPDLMLRRVFGVVLLLISIKLIFTK